MKIMTKNLAISIGAILTFLSLEGAAQEASLTELVSIKCYVELLGGAETVYYVHNVLVNDEQGVINSLKGKNIAPKSYPTKKIVYKIKECQRANVKFNSAAANTIELDRDR